MPNGRVAPRLVVAAIALPLALSAAPAGTSAGSTDAAAATTPQARIQIDPLFGAFNTLGRWAPVIIRDAGGPDAGPLRGLVTFSPYGPYTSPLPWAASVAIPISFGEKERKEFRALLPLSDLATTWWIQFRPDSAGMRARDVELTTQVIQARRPTEEPRLLVVGTVEAPFAGLARVLRDWVPGFLQGELPPVRWVAPTRPLPPAQLPDHWLALDGFDAIVLHQVSRGDLSPAQWRALAQWTAGGRILLFSERAGSNAMAGCLDFFGDLVLPRETVTAAAVQGPNLPVSLGRPVELVALGPIDPSRPPPLARAHRVGLGRVVLLALDLADDATLQANANLQRQLGLLLAAPETLALLPGTASPFGLLRWGDDPGPALQIPDLAGAILGSASLSFGIIRATFLLLLAYIILVGPGTWLLLKRRDRLEWIGGTTLILALFFLLMIGGVGLGARRQNERLITIHITEITPDWRWALQHTQSLILPAGGRSIEVRAPDVTTPTLELPAPGNDRESAARDPRRSVQTTRIEPGRITSAPLMARFFTTFGIHPLSAESRAQLAAAAAAPPPAGDPLERIEAGPPRGETIVLRLASRDELERQSRLALYREPTPWIEFADRVIQLLEPGRVILFNVDLPEIRACEITPAPAAHQVLSAVILPATTPPPTEPST